MKAIAIFELPKRLEERYKLDEFSADVILTRETIVMGDPYIESFRIPQPEVVLKPLPNKLELRKQEEWLGDVDRYEVGFNACIDEITREENDI